MSQQNKRRSFSISSVLEELCTYLHLYQSSLPDIKDDVTLAEAEDDMIDQAEEFIARMCSPDSDMKESLLLYASAILKGWRMAMEKNIKSISQKSSLSEEDKIKEWIKGLKGHTNIGQRTAEWYEQGARLLTGSEIHTLFGSPYQRGQLVLSKAFPSPRMSNKLVCRTQTMTAFDWGIRFEPVVGQIYENLTKSKLIDLGRIVSPRDPRVAASPDAIVIQGERLGRLVEMKAPVTRIINGVIPHEYYSQMQTQMEVCDAPACDYIEVKFISPYKVECGPNGPGEIVVPFNVKYQGYIYIMREDDIDIDPDDMFYEPKLSYYYPAALSSRPYEDIGNYRRDQVVEMIPWYSNIHSLKTVYRSAEWWADMQRRINEFWGDVELAKEGKFEAPASSRTPKVKPDTVGQQQTSITDFIDIS
jgi:hypothetical protein